MNDKLITTIYLCRHGEVHNPKNIVYGRLPGHGLSTRGNDEASALAYYLSDKRIDAIYTSPLLRTLQTAQAVAVGTDVDRVETDDRLLEVKTQFDGISWDIMNTTYKGDFYQEEFIRNGGESLDDIWKRMNSVIDELVIKHLGERIVLVSHGDPIMTVATKLRGEELTVDSIRKDYVTHAHGFKIEFMGITCTSIEPLEF